MRTRNAECEVRNKNRWSRLTSAATGILLLAGCASAPLKGGKASTSQAAGGTLQTISQGENPAAVSRQDQETVKVRS